MPTLPADMLESPAPAGARRVALAALAEAADAFTRLDRADDPEALHDFRVGLRRLRSALRSYAPELDGALSRKLQRRLRRLARATGASRDAEVHAAWLDEARGTLEDAEQAGAAYFATRLSEARRSADAVLADEVLDRFPALRHRIARRLRHYTATVDVEEPDAGPVFAATSAALVERLAGDLGARLEEVRGIEDQDAAHEARIAGKRLRYALEPLADFVPESGALVKRLKRLQDALGDLHDAHVFAEEVERLAADAGGGDAAEDPGPGLAALGARLHARRAEAFDDARRWLGGGDGAALLADARTLADSLAARARAGVEVERKYLLRAFPDSALDAPPAEIDQGYLPGDRLVERVRRVRTLDGERYYRTVKLGAGVRRIEVEEATTRELFDALWPLTAGRRVRKRRHLVPDGDLTWEIDDFADRDLVLAEVEFPASGAQTRVAIPNWLAPYVVRDVTDEPEYVNARLAR
jgi:CHAD domain-containing protein/CYTH domain-containing protein